MAALLGRFRAANPEIDLVLREGFSASLAEALRADTIDCAFTTWLSREQRRGLNSQEVASEPLVAVLPHGHRLARRERLSLKDLAGEDFVLFSEGATIRGLVNRTSERLGFRPHVSFEAGETSRIRSIVAEGLGVSVLPRSDALTPGPPVAVAGAERPGHGPPGVRGASGRTASRPRGAGVPGAGAGRRPRPGAGSGNSPRSEANAAGSPSTRAWPAVTASSSSRSPNSSALSVAGVGGDDRVGALRDAAVDVQPARLRVHAEVLVVHLQLHVHGPVRGGAASAIARSVRISADALMGAAEGHRRRARAPAAQPCSTGSRSRPHSVSS